MSQNTDKSPLVSQQLHTFWFVNLVFFPPRRFMVISTNLVDFFLDLISTGIKPTAHHFVWKPTTGPVVTGCIPTALEDSYRSQTVYNYLHLNQLQKSNAASRFDASVFIIQYLSCMQTTRPCFYFPLYGLVISARGQHNTCCNLFTTCLKTDRQCELGHLHLHA